MANMTKQYWNNLSKDEREALIKIVSADNILTGRGPSFRDYCAVNENTVTLTKEDLRVRSIALFVWGFMFGVGIAVFVI